MPHKKEQAFRCVHCNKEVTVSGHIGTANRNHCNFCLWSKHVDIQKGDRNAICQASMKPIGLTQKREGFSKWGELMLIHRCTGCNKISINRIAADDTIDEILKVFEESQKMDKDLQQQLTHDSIVLLEEEDRQEVEVQLFGK